MLLVPLLLATLKRTRSAQAAFDLVGVVDAMNGCATCRPLARAQAFAEAFNAVTKGPTGL